MVCFTGWGEPPTVSTLRQYYYGTTTIILITVQLQSNREHSNFSPTRYCSQSCHSSLFRGRRSPIAHSAREYDHLHWALLLFLIRCLSSADCTYRLKLERPSYQSNIYLIGSSLTYLVWFDCCFPIPRDAMFSIGTSRWLKLYRISKY